MDKPHRGGSPACAFRLDFALTLLVLTDARWWVSAVISRFVHHPQISSNPLLLCFLFVCHNCGSTYFRLTSHNFLSTNTLHYQRLTDTSYDSSLIHHHPPVSTHFPQWRPKETSMRARMASSSRSRMATSRMATNKMDTLRTATASRDQFLRDVKFAGPLCPTTNQSVSLRLRKHTRLLETLHKA